MAANLVHLTRCLPLLVGACSFTAGGNITDASSIDAARADAAIDAPSGCTTFTCNGNTLTCETDQEVCTVSCSTAGGAHCTQFTPSNGAEWTDLANVVDTVGDLTLTNGTLINSDTGTIETRTPTTTIRGAGQGVINGYRFRIISPQVSLLAFDDLTIAAGANVRITGAHALIIFARNTITISGEINADGGRVTDPAAAGPGGGDGAVGATAAGGCGSGLNGGFDSNQDAGGGAGGSFGRKGGNGGANLGALAANVCADTLKVKLQGGSGGGRGGNPNNSGNGGGGGGAVQFTAGLSISVAGLLHAGGAGGQSSRLNGGGGGAGAGGGFLFESPTVNISANATIVTNGGGGGDGKDVTTNGETGHANLNVAAGAGKGGKGGAVDKPAEAGTGNQNMGSGGGGGGIGKIEIISVNINPIMNGAKLSPLMPTIAVLVGN